MNTLPYNLDAERLILSLAINKAETTTIICKTLSLDAFYLQKHQIIFAAIQELNSKDKPVDLLTVTTALKDKFLLDDIGGVKILTDLVRISNTGINVIEYLGLIQDKYIRRSLINLGYETIEAGYRTKVPLEQALKQVETKLFDLSKKNSSGPLLSTAEVISSILKNVKEKATRTSEIGLMSLFYDLDAITQGFQKSDLVIIAGRPSMGKTAFCLNLTRNIALKYKKAILLFSLEMSKEQLSYRLLSSDCGIELSRLRTGRVRENELAKLNHSIKKLSNLTIFIDDNPSSTLSQIRLKIRELIIEKIDLGLVVIDYLQLLPAPSQKSNRVQEISEITRLLKAFAREFDITILALSQLSRNVESRTNKRPILSDLRESGCVCNTQLVWTQNLSDKYLISHKEDTLVLNEKFSLSFSGTKPCYKLKFYSNIELILTSNHKILTSRGWKRVDELERNDEVAHYLIQSKNSKYGLEKTYVCVKKILYFGIRSTYDLDVSSTRNFICEGFVLHNSIEQDADLVIMLYRDEYYNKKTVTPNIIELQIAKHRNGPLGLVKLYFNPKINRFYNITKSLSN